MAEIRNQQASMAYRRFGRTERHLSVITLGGMRYPHGWEKPRDELPAAMIDTCRDSVQRAFSFGINHIETAFGYGKSEHCYGQVLNQELAVPRQSYHLMTKGAAFTADEMRRMVEKQLSALQTDHIDLYAWHGINTRDRLDAALAKGGPVDALHALRDEGVIGEVGFSTHAPLDVILDAIHSDRFSFLNLHYYYFYQTTWSAIELAASKDMGVFIISPNDKGGRLYDPPTLLREITAPLSPIQWNARFCLATPKVHTLSFGMNHKAHFEEMHGVLPLPLAWSGVERDIEARLDARLDMDAYARISVPLELAQHGSGINIPEALRLRRLWKCYDMVGYGKFRYRCFGREGHWYPGEPCDEAGLAQVEDDLLPGVPLKALLRELHEALGAKKPAS